MIRPMTALLSAALMAVALALVAGYAVYPTQGDAAELSIAELPRTAIAPERNSGDALHQVREHPTKQERLASPFLPEHPTRSETRKPAAPPKQTLPEAAKPIKREMPAEKDVRLVGIAASETGQKAILSMGKRQFLLSPGEEKEGVTLVSLVGNTAVVSTASGERTLSLQNGL